MDSISAYLALQEKFPDLFCQNEELSLELEKESLEQFTKESGQAIGILFDNSPYFILLGDVIKSNNRRFRYTRFISPHHPSDGVVVIATHQGKFCLIELFRHAHRQNSLEFPRGFAESMTPAENAAKELREEICAVVSPDSFIHLGIIRSNTGMTSGQISVFTVEIPDAAVNTENDEAILSLNWMTEDEFLLAITQDRITCGITLAAYMKYRAWKEHTYA